MRTRPLIGLALLCLAALIGAACSSTPIDVTLPAGDATAGPTEVDDEAGPTATPIPTPAPTPTPVGRAELPEDTEFEIGPRLAIQTADHQIVTVALDGTNLVPLTDPAEGRSNRTPRWSDDGNRLAWVAAEPDRTDVVLRSARFDGSGWGEVPLPDEPIHLAWDPSGSQVATLARVAGGVLELGVTDIDGDLGYRPVDQGAPFWFAWNPDADGFLVNASGLRLDFVPIDGPSQVLEQNPGQFQAPVWLSGPPVQLIYADRQGEDQFLVVSGREGSGRRALVTYDGYLQFSASPETGVVALQVIDPSLAPVPDVITASFQGDEFVDEIDEIPRNQLTIMALFGGDPFVLYPSPGAFQVFPVRGFWWSNDGQLAWILETEPGDGNCASETAIWELQFWTGTEFVGGPRFIPTPTFACEYMPGFDQLDQSVSFWSPDGAVFTYAGTNPFTGQRGVWNHQVGTFDDPTFVADGEIGIWSPDTAGSAAASSL